MAGKRKAGGAASVPAGSLDAVEALGVLRRLLSGEAETPDEGFLTTRQWAKVWNLGVDHVSKLLRHGVAAGKVEIRQYRIGEARQQKVSHYRVTP